VNLEGIKRILELGNQVLALRQRLEALEAELEAARAEVDRKVADVHRSYRRDLVPVRPRTEITLWARGGGPRRSPG
jgi:MerR family transcriptional regulator/heat shock protein HspR